MRSIGQAEMALSSIIYRAHNRTAFGEKLVDKDSIRQIIAESRLEITKCRQLCYLAAVIADERGFKAARKYIAMIKVAAPRMALKVVDEAIQVHGAAPHLARPAHVPTACPYMKGAPAHAGALFFVAKARTVVCAAD